MSENNIKRDESMNVAEMVQNQQKSVQEAKHGEVVTDSDGVSGIVIDSNVEMEKNKPESLKNIESYLETQQRQINQLQNGGAVEDEGMSLEEIERRNLERMAKSDAPGADPIAMQQIIEASSKLAPTADGLAPKGSKKAMEYKDAMENNVPDEIAKMANVEKPVMNDTEKTAKELLDNNGAGITNIVNNAVQPEVANVSNGTSTTFNVPEGQARIFLDTLPKDARENVVRSKEIVVNEVKKRDIPVVTRKISSINEFKRVLPRKAHSETKECVLPNSGITVVVKGCGSLAMASLVPDDDNRVDYRKRYQFVYDNLVTTSIGKLSFIEFCDYVAYRDLEIAIFAIYSLSEPDESNIILQCGGEGGCGEEYTIKFRISELIDPDSITEDTAKQIDHIVKNKDTYENAKKVWKESPVQSVKTMDIVHNGGEEIITIELKTTSGSTMIERSPLFIELSTKYNQYIVGFLLFIPRIYYTIKNPAYAEDNSVPEEITYEIDDPTAIAEMINDLDDDEIQSIGQVMGGMVDYPVPTYSFKGEFNCPNCGKIEKNVPCTVDSLVFFKVGKAIS